MQSPGPYGLSGIALAFMDALSSYELDTVQLRKAQELRSRLPADLSARIPSELIDEVALEALAISGDPAFGLSVGSRFAMKLHHLYFLMQASSSLADALERFAKFQVVVSDALAFTVQRADGEYAIRLGAPEPAEGRWIPTDAIFSVTIHALRGLSLYAGLKPLEAWTRRPAASISSAYERLLGCPVHFSAEENKLRLSAADMLRPLPTANQSVLAQLEPMVRAYVDELEEHSVTSRLRRLIALEVRAGAPDRAEMARRMGMSDRSLARKLRAEGSSFRRTVDEVRASLSQSALRGGASVTEAAFSVGFSDSSSFSRAYRRWTGDSPTSHFSD